MSAHACADARAGVFAAYRVGGAAFESLNQGGDRQRGRVGDQQVHVVGFAVELDQIDAQISAHTSHMVCSAKVSMVSVNTFRRYFVTNTRWACSNDTLCRARR